jgi:hypothetical protein
MIVRKSLPLFTIIVFLFSSFITPILKGQGQNPQKLEDLIALIKEKSGLELRLDDSGWQWKAEDIKGTPEAGEATFSGQKWLMYLIHWGPVQKKEITIDYVKERMLGMWGVKFEFSGKEGRLKIAGHAAVFVEAFGTNRSFYTRFIIWNCPESGREFIADTNYNLRFRTPESDFEDEQRSVMTLQCHKGAKVDHFLDLTRTFASEKYGFSFCYPERWFMFDSPYYVPFPEYEGIRDKKMGSLLALPSDQNITVILKWSPQDKKTEEMVMGVEQKTMAQLVQEVEILPGIEAVKNLGFESFHAADKKIDRVWGLFTRNDLEKGEEGFFTKEGIYQAARMTVKGKNLVIILRTRRFAYSGVESTPDRHILDGFFRDLLLKIT